MAKTITFNELRKLKDSLPDGATHQIADKPNITVPGPDGGIVVLDDTTIYDMALDILKEQKKD